MIGRKFLTILFTKKVQKSVVVGCCWHVVVPGVEGGIGVLASRFQPWPAEKKLSSHRKKTAKFAQKNGVKPRAVHVSHPISNMFKLHSNSCWDPPGKFMLKHNVMLLPGSLA